MSRLVIWAATAFVALGLAACGESKPQQQGGPQPAAVTVAKPTQQTVTDQDEYVGRFVAVDSVEVRSRVSGYLSDIHFTDGQMVSKGDLLLVIDPRPYENAAASARATVMRVSAKRGGSVNSARGCRSRAASLPYSDWARLRTWSGVTSPATIRIALFGA